jgi:glycosyltransferase involved in cell wall biosynthesis
VQTWLYHSDLLGGLATKISNNIPVIWSIHNGKLNTNDKITTRIIAKLCAVLSTYIPSKIVYVAKSSQLFHTMYGYNKTNAVIIPNGFDNEQFCPDIAIRQQTRDELGLNNSHTAIGLIARYDQQKDHVNFLKAAKILLQKHENVRFVMCGDKISIDNKELINIINDYSIVNYCMLLGRRSDVSNIINACDIVASSSCSEAFPLVVGEAMSCGVPCAVTDVGDSAWIVGDTGRVVPPRDPEALATAWAQLIEIGPDLRNELGMKARQRIIDNFSLNAVVKQYERLYEDTFLKN